MTTAPSSRRIDLDKMRSQLYRAMLSTEGDPAVRLLMAMGYPLNPEPAEFKPEDVLALGRFGMQRSFDG